MKKIFLLMTIMTSLFFALSIDSKAYTFNGSYDFSNIDLNASISELNGASLNDLFNYEYLNNIPLNEINGLRNKYELINGVIQFSEYLYYNEVFFDLNEVNRVINGDFNNGTTNILNKYSSLSISNNILSITGDGVYARTFAGFDGSDIFENSDGDTFFAYAKVRATNNDAGSINLLMRDAPSGFIQAFFDSTNLNNTWVELYGKTTINNTNYNSNSEFYIQTNYVDSATANGKTTEVDGNKGVYAINMSALAIEHYTNENMLDLINGLPTIVIEEYTTPIQNTDLTQSLYLYNLENMNIDLLNYYFAVYLLNAFDLPIGDLWAYAYTAGNDAGYNDGFTDGYDSGYTTGFDTGNLQGYTSGYDYGYDSGFDDGVISEVDTQWLLGFVTGTVNVLGVSIIPGISLGVFVFIPLFLGFIGFIFRLGGRRG